MKRMLALFLALCLLLGSACAEGADYTVAIKLIKQLAAGSGFSGILTLEADTQTFSTVQPLVLDIDYIFVRPQEVSLGEHRADLTLMNGDEAITQAHVQVLNGDVAVQADVISPDWYALQGAEAEAGKSTMLSNLLYLFTALKTTKGMDQDVDLALENALESASTRVDIWIEGYRQGTELTKQENGETAVKTEYAITPLALKSQVKQLVFDLLDDEAALSALQQALGEEMAVYLDPRYQAWYFDCIDALPLSDDLTLSRLVSLEGETLALNLKLPLYDSELGALTLCYDLLSGETDLPDEHTLTLENESQILSLRFQQYKSMTGVEVIQGTLQREFTTDFAVGEEAPFEVAFTLKTETAEGKDESDRDVYTYNATLTLVSEDVETEAVLTSRFVSEERKSAATQMDATLTLTQNDDAVEMTFSGASRKKWEPEALPSALVAGEKMTELLPGAGVRLVEALSDLIKVGE